MTTKEQLLSLLEPVVSGLGYELIEIEHPDGLVRLYIDSETGVSLDDCERVSEQVGAVLDVENPISGPYTLEVSSPGERRFLRTTDHFERFAGERIKLELREPIEGRRRMTGQLKMLEGNEILVEVDGRDFRLPLAGLETARLAPLRK